MNDIEKVFKFLDDAGIFYLSTVKDNKPKSRPFNFKMMDNNQIYFGTGTFKEVYKQIIENTYVEILSTVDPKFIRYYGKVAFDDDESLVEKAFEKMPFMKQIYNEKTGLKLRMFHLEDATCEFRNKSSIKPDEVINL